MKVALFSLCLVALAVSVNADGFGSVWVDAVTDSKITLNWSGAVGNYRDGSSPPKFKICYKKSGAWIGACSDGEELYVTQKPYPVENLSASELYKFKVYTYAEKKNALGKWKDAEYRLVGTLTQATDAASSQERQGKLEFIGATSQSITVRATWSHPGDFEFLRVCYKKTGNIASLEGTCKTRNDPSNNWKQSTEARGWFDIEPAVASYTVAFDNPALADCRHYKAVAYGFYTDATTGLFIGETKGDTNGKCKANRLQPLSVNDRE